jgi:hypothetical protein
MQKSWLILVTLKQNLTTLERVAIPSLRTALLNPGFLSHVKLQPNLITHFTIFVLPTTTLYSKSAIFIT